MDGKEGGLSSFYHHQQHLPTTTTTTNNNISTNGIFSSSSNPPNTHYSSEFPPLLFSPRPSSAPDALKRKRGRPRKYAPTGTAESTSKKSATVSPSFPLPSTSSVSPSPSLPSKKDAPSPKKLQLDALGKAGHGFTPHVITVAAGEDVCQKIMSFMQLRKRAVCILSASGSISNASLSQPAMVGGSVTYEGRFEILSLSGSFLYTETEGASSRTGGLSVCLSGAGGHIVGGGVGGPLKAGGPVQVIVGSFVIDAKKDYGVKPEASASGIGPTVSPISFRSTQNSSARGNDGYHNTGSSGYILQSHAMNLLHRSNADVELTDRSEGHRGACQSPEDGDDYD